MGKLAKMKESQDLRCQVAAQAELEAAGIILTEAIGVNFVSMKACDVLVQKTGDNMRCIAGGNKCKIIIIN